MSQGQLLVNYLGHGSTNLWGSGLLSSADLIAQWRPGSRLPLVVAMNCLNGLFFGIYGEESLAETFLRASEGAVATWCAWSRYVTATAKDHGIVLVEESGTWSTGWSIVGRPE